MNRIEFVKFIYKEALNDLNDYEKWKEFNRFQGQLYKYNFVNSLLIWKQTPNARLVADLNVWNKFNRRVLKGTKSIAIIDDTFQKLKNVFDISSTYQTKNQSLHLWYIEGKEEAIKNSLNKKYNIKEKNMNSLSINEFYKKIIRQAVYEKDMQIMTEIQNKFHISENEAMHNTLGCFGLMIYGIECGLEDRLNLKISTEDNEIKKEFEHINDKGLLEYTGSYISDIIEDILRDTEGSVKEYDRERKEKIEENINRERNRIYPRGRWNILSEFGRGREPRKSSDDIRKPVGRVHENESSTSLAGIVSTGRTSSNERIDRATSNRDYEAERSVLSGEKSDSDRKLPGLSGENDTGERVRNGVRERISIPVSVEITEEEITEFLIRHSSGAWNGKYRIQEFFIQNKNAKQRDDFLKKEWGIGSLHLGKHELSAMWDAKGIIFERSDSKRKLSWSEIRKKLEYLIETKIFFTEKDLLEYPAYREKQITNKINREKAFFDYQTVGKLFLFGKNYEIKEIKENQVVLQETDFPLNVLNITKDDFEKEAIMHVQNDEYWVTEEEHLLVQSEREANAYVRVLWSEAGIAEQSLFSFSVANQLFKEYDDKIVMRKLFEEYGYDKTKFQLFVRLEDGEIVEYTGRQDFGDGDGSLFDHIHLVADSVIADKELRKEMLSVLEREVGIVAEKESEKVYKEESKEHTEEIENIEKTIDLKEETEILDIAPSADEKIEAGGIGEKTKFEWNLAAISTLKELEKENRPAMEKEKEILKRFLGWGGLSKVFDNQISDWEKERETLKELLTEDEYNQAKSSVMNSHYTPEFVINEIHQYLKEANIKGKILEPSAGIGRFLKPHSNVEYTAVEIDEIPARIMSKIYPNVTVEAKGLEETDFQNNSFDAVIGNVPFGNYQVFDKEYAKEKFMIHDYFFAKTLDKVKPNGVMVLITGKGTMDKASPEVRKYIQQRAKLLGAIRLPSGTFSKLAGTDVSADILFLQKRERFGRMEENESNWIDLAYTEDKIPVNEYFLSHPEHLLGKMVFDERFFGKESKYTNCIIEENSNLKLELKKAFETIQIPITKSEKIEEKKRNAIEQEIIETDEKSDINEIENFTFAYFDEKAYYRNGENLEECNLSGKRLQRLSGMISLREHCMKMIQEQRENCSDERLLELQNKLNVLYEDFVKEHGEISGKENQNLFQNDKYSPFLFSLEQQDKEGKRTYSDLFTKRILKAVEPITSADNAKDALLISLNERGKVDLSFMRKLLNAESEQSVIDELKGQIYYEPESNQYVTADDYLSGNVREKLKQVKKLLREGNYPEEYRNVLMENEVALKEIIPEDIEIMDIEVRLGTTWIKEEDYEEFMYSLFKTPYHLRNGVINLEYNKFTGIYHISNKSSNNGNILVQEQYGTQRKNAYEILEDTLNLKDIRIYDYKQDGEKRKRIYNHKETILVREKQALLKEEFKSWIWENMERRNYYHRYYNDTFNNIRLREYDGEFLTFSGINQDIKLRKHQKDAIARTLISGKNTLLAHAVGAGKTYEMIASCMEGKRLGLWGKPLFVVPNHLTQQTGLEFLNLYPAANILVATEKDFQKENRELFFAKMATGNYDAIIIGQTQLIRLGLSKENQIKFLRKEINEAKRAIEYQKNKNSERWTVKSIEQYLKKLEFKIKDLSSKAEKTDLLSFEDLKIDQLFIDEAHHFKSLATNTKMNNVAGLGSKTSQRAIDLLMKVDYLREYYLETKAQERGAVFATATPLANSMVEMYVMQRYLQNEELKKRDIHSFDSWATIFGETVASMELAPEGKGFRMRTRFAKFVNLPELLSIFQEIADIKTDKMLNLERPEADFQVIQTEASDFVKEKIFEFSERVDKIRDRLVSPTIDNMLKITHEGRLLGTDPRLLYYDEYNQNEWKEQTKLDVAADNIYQIYKETTEKKGVQVVFSDIGVPNKEKDFTVYDYLKSELIKRGIPEDEICFIHDASNSKKKQLLFNQLISGQKRIIIGSTDKMGTGVNVQNKAVALHHIDCPWKSSDIEQREGRVIRYGNKNEKVQIFKYITSKTFDAYLWQIVEKKQRFIDQVMNNRLVSRMAEDIDDKALNYAQIKAQATGNPLLEEWMEIDMEIGKLELLKADFNNSKYKKESVLVGLIGQIEQAKKYLENCEKDYAKGKENFSEDFQIELKEKGVIFERAEATKILKDLYYGEFLKDDQFKGGVIDKEIGSYHGFNLFLRCDSLLEPTMVIKGNRNLTITSGSWRGMITKLENRLTIESLQNDVDVLKRNLEELIQNKEELESKKKETFPHEEKLKTLLKRKTEIDLVINHDKMIIEDVEEEIDDEITDEMKETEIEL